MDTNTAHTHTIDCDVTTVTKVVDGVTVTSVEFDCDGAPARPLGEVLAEHVTEVTAQREELPLAERRILEDLLDRGIDPVAVTRRRHRTHIDGLVARGLLTIDDWPRIAIVDEVAALVALGRACGQHDRPLPCAECA